MNPVTACPVGGVLPSPLTPTRWLLRRAAWGAVIALAQPFLCATQSLGAMRAGLERIDITPPPGARMGGYGARQGVATGILDPLFAQVLVLDDGRTSVALVTLDLIAVFDREGMDAIRQRARASGIQDVVFVNSHTHSGPIFSSIPESYSKALDAVAMGIERARKNTVEVRFGAGWGAVQIGFNRRYEPPSGPAVMQWRNETAVATFPIDPTVGVIRLDGEDGQPLAILVHYACHPVVLGPDNLAYSADYPGEMRRTIETAFPNSMAFFLQGGAGNINPFHDKTPLIQDAVTLMRATGRKLGEEAVRTARAITTRPPETPEIKVSVSEMEFAPRYDPVVMEAALRERYGDGASSRVVPQGPAKLPVTTIVLNRDLAFVGMPGEPFVEFQLYLRAQSPLPHTYFLGYCNGAFGYIPTIEASVRGGYGAAGTTTRYEVGFGEHMIHRGIVEIYKLLGMLKPTPEDPS